MRYLVTEAELSVRRACTLAVEAVPNAVWSIDFMHDTLYVGRRFRTLNVLDEGMREVLGIEIDNFLTGPRVARVLKQLKALRGKPVAIRCDNKSELLSKLFVT